MPPRKKTLLSLAVDLADLQAKRGDIDSKIAEIEADVIKITGFAKPEGQQSFDEDDGSSTCKFTLKQNVNRSLDVDIWSEEVSPKLPAKIRRAVVMNKPTLVMAGINALRDGTDEQKATYALIAKAVTTKPGKVSVKLDALVQREKGADS